MNYGRQIVIMDFTEESENFFAENEKNQKNWCKNELS